MRTELLMLSNAQARDALELLFVQEAEMVFTTLSSTGRKIFGRLDPGHFETVLIDEAAQASEIASLQALAFGCKRCALFLFLSFYFFIHI